MIEQISKFLTTRIVYHGPGALSRLPLEIAKLGGKRIGIITDGGVVTTGIPGKIADALKTDTFCFDRVVPEPPYELVDQCAAFLRDNKCDVLIGVGGGSSLDTAKMSGVMLTNNGRVPDYFGADKIPKPGVPVIAVPTTAGTGSEVSPAAVFVDSADQTKKGARSDFLLPEAAIIDPQLTLSLPPGLTASTGIDALTHAIECYTSLAATAISDLVAEKAIAMISANIREAFANGNSLQARNGMLMGSFLAGIALAVANVGAVHALAQTVGGLYHIAHGVSNALFLPYVMDFNRIGCREKYARVADLMGVCTSDNTVDEASQKAVDAVRRLTLDLQIPQSLSELEIPQECIESGADRCLQTQGRILSNNPRAMDTADAGRILQAAFDGQEK